MNIRRKRVEFSNLEFEFLEALGKVKKLGPWEIQGGRDCDASTFFVTFRSKRMFSAIIYKNTFDDVYSRDEFLTDEVMRVVIQRANKIADLRRKKVKNDIENWITSK